MNATELQTLLDKISDQTQKGQLKWKAEADRTFRVDFPRSSIEITKFLDDVNLHSLDIYNSAGTKIGAIDHGFSSDAPAKLANIYEKAYSLALEVDTTVKDILAGLEGSQHEVTPGIYAAKFSPLSGGSTIGEGLVIIGKGHINGGDLGYIYRGSYELKGTAISASLKVSRWNQSSVSIFGPLPNFDLALTGQFGATASSVVLEGNVVQHANLRIRIECRRIVDAML
jgi:T3SS negative regulator,GrlR